MAQVDVQWPSEDEDFDATIDKTIKSRSEEAGVPVSAPTAVAVPDQAGEKPEPQESAEAVPKVIEPSSRDETGSAPLPPVSEPETAAPPVVPVTKDNSPKSESGKRGYARTVFETVLVLAVIGLAAWSSMLVSEKNEAQAQASKLQTEVTKLYDNPQIAVQKQTDDLLKKVSALMQLPTDETPTVANVSDAEAAKKQSAFFSNAQNGDRVLMYVKAGEAILYRPSTNKIILVAPLTFSDTTPKTSAATPRAGSTTNR